LVHELSPRGCTSVTCKSYSWDRISDTFEELEISPCVQGNDANDRLASLIQGQAKGSLFLYDPPYAIFHFSGETIRLGPHPVGVGYQDGTVHYYVHSVAPPVFYSYTHEHSNSLKLDSSVQRCLLAPGGFIATNDSSTKWQVMNIAGELQSTTMIPPEYQVLGFITGKGGGFVVMDATNTRISFVTNDSNETWFDAPAPMRTINVIPGCMLMAFSTVENELCVYSRDHKTFFLRMRLGET
jgi:hypothetical protein